MRNPFVGRTPECVRLEHLLRTTAAGRGAVLVVRGAAGIGKTVLLEHCVRHAAEHQVVRVRTVAGEADLPYSAIHLLCSALAAHLVRLDPHHRAAIETVLGLRPDPVPDRLLVGVAVGKLLCAAAAVKPLLCVVDDMHWLDDASADVLAFVARRLAPVPVGLLIAGRGDGFESLPDLVVHGLGHADARRLFDSALATAIDDAVAERIVAETRGNPLLLVESARRSATAEAAGGYGVPTSTGVECPALARLSGDSRLLLVLAAAEPLGDPGRLWRAAARLGIAASAAEHPESLGLLAFGQWVTFRDPRMRSLVYSLASTAERRRAHGALAAATDRAAEPDRHLWHLAHALAEPDDQVGAALAQVETIARDRGGLAAAAGFLEKAALCTTDPERRTTLAIHAAEAYHDVGATDTTARLIATAELGRIDATGHARLTNLRARIHLNTHLDRAAVAQLWASAQELDEHEPGTARHAYLEALDAAILAGHVDAVRPALARIAAWQPRETGTLLEGLALRHAHGYAAAVEPLKLALKTTRNDGEHDHPRARTTACLVAADLWDEDSWDELTDAQLRRTRQLGTRALLPGALTHRALVEIHIGQFAAARALATEATTIARELHTPPLPDAAAVLAAWRGHDHPTLATDEPHRPDEGMAVAVARYARAVLSNGRGAYGDAVTAVGHVLEHDVLALRGWSLVELAEGAVRSGNPDTAAAAVDLLTERACLAGTDWALGMAARSRALLHHGADAEHVYLEAIDRLSRSRGTIHAARARLLYGEWLRRQGMRIDARVPLKAAHRTFTDLGAEAFAARTERELLATGERARRRVAETSGELTPQEKQIASMARDGMTNPTIATRLSISPRTVEYHLHKVFTKIGINSRNELHRVLPAPTAIDTPLRR